MATGGDDNARTYWRRISRTKTCSHCLAVASCIRKSRLLKTRRLLDCLLMIIDNWLNPIFIHDLEYCIIIARHVSSFCQFVYCRMWMVTFMHVRPTYVDTNSSKPKHRHMYNAGYERTQDIYYNSMYRSRNIRRLKNGAMIHTTEVIMTLCNPIM